MGKVYKNQTAHKLYLHTGLTLSEYGTITSALIKYKKPDTERTEGSFTAELGDFPYITYQIDSVDDLDVVGEWIFWSYITMVDGTVAPGEIDTLYIYPEGT